MSGHEGVKVPGGTTFYFGHKPAPAARDRTGDIGALLRELADRVDALLAGLPFEPLGLGPFGVSPDTLADVLGEGEVKLWVHQPGFVTEIVESVMPGVWRLTRRTDDGAVAAESIDVGGVPRLVNEVMEQLPATGPHAGALPEGTMSAGPILHEIGHHMAEAAPHTIVLTNLPMSLNDMEALTAILDEGPVAGGSKGYSTTRVRSTAFRRVWRTQYLNSGGQVIYDAIEIASAPLALAAPREDIEDGRRRLADLLKIYAKPAGP